MNDDWKKEFESKVRKLRSYITFTDYNMYNYRLDILGCESSYLGFKTVIIYYQLSTAINVSAIGNVLKCL